MAENSYLKRPRSSQRTLFRNLTKGFSKIGLEKFELSRRREEEKALKLSRTKNKRQKEAEDCVSFRRYFHDSLFVEVFPTFNTETGFFTEEGMASVLVKRPSVKKGFKVCLGMYFPREEGMVGRILVITEFVTKVLQNQPRDRNSVLMQLKRVGDANFAFVSKETKEKISILDPRFLELFEKRFQKRVLEIFNTRKKYHKRKDPNTESIRKIKKKRKVGAPQSVVPVLD